MHPKFALYLDLIRWNRPAGWLLLLWPTLSALWLAAGGFPGWHLIIVFTLGTILMRSAGCCINDVADQEFDRHVKRTAQRPVTRGALSTRQALEFGAGLALIAFGLVLTTNPITIAWSVLALCVTILYPYAKRVVAMPQAVLGIAFSFGIPMAFAAVRAGDSWSLATMLGAIPDYAWLLVLGNLCWVLAYDTEYAMVDRDDDLRIGIKTSAITLGRADVPAVLVFYALYLAIWSWVISPMLGAHTTTWWLAIGCAGMQVMWHARLIWQRSREGCFTAFRLNHWLGFTLWLGLVFSL